MRDSASYFLASRSLSVYLGLNLIGLLLPTPTLPLADSPLFPGSRGVWGTNWRPTGLNVPIAESQMVLPWQRDGRSEGWMLLRDEAP